MKISHTQNRKKMIETLEQIASKYRRTECALCNSENPQTRQTHRDALVIANFAENALDALKYGDYTLMSCYL